MGTTVLQLYRRLGALIEAGHGRKPVLIDKSTFNHPLESDGVTMLDLAEVRGPQWMGLADDDGGTRFNKNGTEAGKTVVVLAGERELRKTQDLKLDEARAKVARNRSRVTLEKASQAFEGYPGPEVLGEVVAKK